MNNLTKRTLSGLLYVAVFTFALLYGQSTYCIAFAVLTALALNEFYNLIEEHQLAYVNSTIATAGGLVLFLCVFCLIKGAIGPVVLLLYLLTVLYTLVAELYLNRGNPIANWAYTFLGQVYIAVPMALMNFVAFYGNAGYHGLLALSVFIFIWLNDTGAYCFGCSLHRYVPYKLFERVSPKKTWIGTAGGFLVVVGAAIALAAISDKLSMGRWIGLGLTVAVSATLGDLVESLFKRQLGIKDSGSFLPGHGGVLDRFDSALLAIPAAIIFLYATEG